MTRALVVLNDKADRDRVARWAFGVPEGTRVEFKPPKRSLPQNDRMWAMLTDIAAHMKKAQSKNFTTDQWKAIFMHACGREVSFLPSLDGQTFIPWGQSSSDLGVKEMTDLIEFMFAWGAENGVTFNEPSDQQDTVAADQSPSGQATVDDEDGPPSSEEDGGDGNPRTVSSPSSLSSSDRQHLMDFARKAFRTATDRELVPAKRMSFIDDMRAALEGEVSPDAYRKSATIQIAALKVCENPADVAKRRDFVARDLLECAVQEIGG